MPELPAPLMLVVDPGRPSAPAGSYAAIASAGQGVLSAELSRRLGAAGAIVTRLPVFAEPASPFHWGAWFTAAARAARREEHVAGRPGETIGYAGAGSLALLGDEALATLISPPTGGVVANNRYSADAFALSGDVDAALDTLSACDTDNAAVRRLEEAGLASQDLGASDWSRFDVDTPLDLALLRLATRLPGTRVLDGMVTAFLEDARLPNGGGLEVPHLAAIGEVIRSREAQLLVAGRIPSSAWSYLETESACRVRCFIEERGMRSSRDHVPRSLLADWVDRLGPADLIGELASLADAVILDSRVLMAARAGSSDAVAWPPEEERFASDFGDGARVSTGWLAELTSAAAAASVPVLLGGHALVSDGLRLLVDAAWLGR
ncbi:MAG TPA: hypothetical protein VFH90_10545 [Candidatus Limnocylindria bacterium]|nr:hypothetical protein [Candidatus Limnocylindria bacterium]